MSSYRAVDSHCHLDYYRNPESAIRDAAEAEVLTVAITSRPSQYRHLKALVGDDPAFRIGLGFHPELAGSYDEPHELLIMRDYFPEATWIGEIGLDGNFIGVPTLEKQRRVLDEILGLGVGDKVLSVHSIAAEEVVVDMLKDAKAGGVVMHGYSGDMDVAERALDLGFYFSVNPWSFDSEEGIAFAKWVPAERLMVETDGPFSTWGGRSAGPGDIPGMVDRLAELRQVDPVTLLAQSARNFYDLEAKAFG